jgi:hypothetical protein
MRLVRYLSLFGLASVLALLSPVSLPAQSPRQAMRQDPACQLLTPVSAGSPLPRDADTVVIRWLGHTNYELVYRGNVFLLDAYYDRVPRHTRLAWRPTTSKKATAILSAIRISIASPMPPPSRSRPARW